MKIKSTISFRNTKICLALASTFLILWSGAVPCRAATVTVGGDFGVTFSSGHPAFQGTEEFSGFWLATYDDLGGNHTGSVAATFTELRFSTVNNVFVDSPSITVGSTDYDSSNMTVSIGLDSGAISGIALSGGFNASNQDFILLNYVDYIQNGVTMEEVIEGLFEVDLGSATTPTGVNQATSFDTSQGTITPSGYIAVPEASSVTLLGLGLGLMLSLRRRTS